MQRVSTVTLVIPWLESPADRVEIFGDARRLLPLNGHRVRRRNMQVWEFSYLSVGGVSAESSVRL